MKIINLENAQETEYKSYKVRETARAIIIDKKGKVGIIHVKNEHIQIIGGGIDEGESIEEGLRRECLEEAGVEIDIVSKLCNVREIKKHKKQIQNSYCYIAKVKGKKMGTKFTKEEMRWGFETKWLKLDEVLKIHNKFRFEDISGEYAWNRSDYIFEKYKKFVKTC